MTFGPLPPTMIGTCGRWIGLGTLRAFATLECWPSKVACWCLSPSIIRMTTSRSSASRARRSRVSGKPYPYASHSSRFQPAPIPSSIRPPLMTSIVEIILAVRAGFRNAVQITMWPRRTRRRDRGQGRERS